MVSLTKRLSRVCRAARRAPKQSAERVVQTFKDPPRQKAASFTIDQIMEKMENSLNSTGK